MGPFILIGPQRGREGYPQPGPDFIVFENAFYIGGNPNVSFAELAFVEVSSDGVTFARFPNHSTNPGPVGQFSGVNPNNISGLAGVHPVLANIDTNTNDPFDPVAAGGDAFDLADLATQPAVQSGQVNLSNIRYLRIIDILGNGATLDSTGNPIYDATDPGGVLNSCDIDAISVIHGCTIGDLNGDGQIDSADAALLAAALLTPTALAATPCADLNADGQIDGADIAAFVSLLTP